jgi:5-deoxy-glucuronate isomerase
VILGGRCVANWGNGEQAIGGRKNVFEGLPYTVYLPTRHSVKFKAEEVCEIAECRVPSEAKQEPRLVTPKEVYSSLRGGRTRPGRLWTSFARIFRQTNLW